MTQTLAARLEECVQSLPAEKRAEVLEDAARYCKRLQQKFGVVPAVACTASGLEFVRNAGFAVGVQAASGVKPQLLRPTEEELQDLAFFRALMLNIGAPYHYLAYAYLGFIQGWNSA